MPSKTKPKSKTKNIIHSKYKKLKIKNKNIVNVHIHKNTRTPVVKNPVKTFNSVVKDTFQPRLPIYQPFVNAPFTQAPLQTPVNLYINGNTLTKNTPLPSALHSHIQSAQSVAQTPVSTYDFTPVHNPIFSPDPSTPIKTTPEKPESVKPQTRNKYDVLSDTDVDDEIEKIASQLNETPKEVRDKLVHWNIVHNGKFTQKANRETDWTIDTFIRHNLPFLYKQGIFNPHEPAPSKAEV